MLRKAILATGLFALVCVAAVVTLRLLFPLPERGAWADEQPPDRAAGALQERYRPLADEHRGSSGILSLQSALDAFAARLELTRAATASIDAQYYIWHDDITGLRLLAELQEAARRGVHVRLLIDDHGTVGLDQELAAFDALPSAEVRLFNPFTLRGFRMLNFGFDFFRLNRRMHNKSMTFDGAATIVGGRNIGDIYFGTGGPRNYIDIDVLAVGQAAADVSADFQRYWTSAAAYPVETLVAAEPGADSLLDERVAEMRARPEAQEYFAELRNSDVIDQIAAGVVPFEWVRAVLFSDDPSKAQGNPLIEDLMVRRLIDEIGTPEEALDLISAYFIAGESATGRLSEMAAEGARVRVLTNSLEATDVVPVHSGYIAYREPLIEGGVRIYELRSEAGERRSVRDLGIADISKAALHAKAITVDRKRAFVGSMNFDPRSRRLNTEMGLLIDSEPIAEVISGWLDDHLDTAAYRVTQGDGGGLVWTTQDSDGEMLVYETEPNTTLPLRAVTRLMQYLPLKWLL